jgi:hypothetical protein
VPLGSDAPFQIAFTEIFLCSKRDATIAGQAISSCGDLQMPV